MASFRKRYGLWQVQVRRKGYQPISKSFVLKADAETWGRQTEADLDKHFLPVDRKAVEQLTLACLIERYANEISPHKRSHAQEKLRLNWLLKLDIAKLSLIQITPKVMANYRDKRLKVVRGSTVKRELVILGHIFEVARREWLIPITLNPVAIIKKPPTPEGRQRRISPEELHSLTEACKRFKGTTMDKLVFFAIETGMRRSELTGLTWENVNLAKRTLLLPLTKNGSSRIVPLSGKAIEILHAIKPQKTGSVFGLSNDAVKCGWFRLMQWSRIKDLHFHDLRHEAVSRFFEKGLSVPEVALISGHKDYRMLMRYTHLRAEDVAVKLNPVD